MTIHRSLLLLLLLLAFGPASGFAQTPSAPPKNKAKTTKAKTKTAKPSPTPKPDRWDEKYEEALGPHSAKKAKIREARQAEQDAQLGPSQAELILQGKPPFLWKSWVGEYVPKLDLTALFPVDPAAPKPAPDYALLEKEWQAVSPRFEILRERTHEQLGSNRGDLESAELREKIAQIYKISLLRLRMSGADQSGAWALTEGDIWMRAITAMAFDESTIETLRWASQMRALYAQEMLAKMKVLPVASFPMDQLQQHLREIKLPWPTDRIFITESRKTLKPGAQLVANQLAGDLQKFPYKSLAQLRKNRRGGDVAGLAALDIFYSENDVKLRQSEEDLFNEYRLRVARAVFEKRQGATLKDLEELKAQGLIDKLPIHHASGQFWSITQL